MASGSAPASPYVFLSYASADRPRALAIANLLEAHGIAVWIDRRQIVGGTSRYAEIVRGIQGCAALALLSSPAVMASPNVQREVQLARETKRPILTLLLESAHPPEAMRDARAGRQRVEILARSSREWFPELLRALAPLGLRPSDQAPRAPPSSPAMPSEEPPDEARPTFGSLLKEHRLARGLSQEALAEGAGLSREGVSLLERGLRRSPHRDTVSLLAKTLELSPIDRARLVAAASEQRASGMATAPARAGPRPALPPRLTSFVGREQEIAEVRQLVLTRRLVTLAGPGGIGKTSLALAVAASLESRFAERVGLAELAGLSDGGLIPHAIGAALGVRERSDEPVLTTVATALGTTARLLLLDNCEHLLASCAPVAEALLRACPMLTLLVTSREPLRIGGEVIWRVPSLALPDMDSAPLEELARSEAIRLFVERAGAVRPGFALTIGNAPAVVEICRRLDGIPLAIELAAARVAALPPGQIARRLDDRFRLLTAGHRTALPRHQTLRALLDWSHDLLSEEERTVFRRLAIFASSWTLAAAEAVFTEGAWHWGPGPGEGTGGPPPAPVPDVLDVLLRLVDKSLVLVEERGGETRYHYLETLREYAREKLAEAGETPAAEAAHAAYFVTWAGGPGPASVQTIMQRSVALPLEVVAAETDNLRAALRYLLDRSNAEAGLALAARIYHLWSLLGPREEGRDWLRRLLARSDPAVCPSRAAAFFAAGWLAKAQGDPTEAQAAFAEAGALAQARGDLLGQALAQTQLGVIAWFRGELARAREELEASVRLAREANAPPGLLVCLVYRGNFALAQGDLASARAELVEARAVLPRFPSMGFLLSWLAGGLALAEGNGELAGQEYQSALADRRAAGDPVGVAISALGLAVVAAVARDGARAARLLGGAEEIALGVGGRLVLDEPVHWAQHPRVEAAARESLGEERFAALRAEGRRMSVDEIVQLALANER